MGLPILAAADTPQVRPWSLAVGVVPPDGPSRRHRHAHATPPQRKHHATRTPLNSRREERDVSTRNPTTPIGWSALPNERRPSTAIGRLPCKTNALQRASEARPQIARARSASVHLSRDGGDKGKGRAPPLHLSRHNRRQIAAVTENIAKKQQFACTAKCARRAALHLSRFQSKSLIYIDHQEVREGRRAGPRALHLSRQGVARLPSARCISPAQALHLSIKVPFFSIETTTFKPLL
jgi:hypothetical protein